MAPIFDDILALELLVDGDVFVCDEVLEPVVCLPAVTRVDFADHCKALVRKPIIELACGDVIFTGE